MTKFDNLIGSTLNEAGLLGSLANVAASTAGGIGTAIKTAQNPANAVTAIKGALDKNKQEEQKTSGSVGKDNPAKKGQYVRMGDNSNIVGKVVDVQNNGMFSVQLVHVSEELEKQIESSQPIPLEILQRSETQKKSDYLFVQTVNNPKWQLVTRQKAKELAAATSKAENVQIVIPENFNKFLVYFSSIIEEKKGGKRTRKPRNPNSTPANPNQNNNLPEPPDGTVITTNVGDNTYDAKTKEWIMPNGQPNPAPGQLLNRWLNTATQQPAPQQPAPQQQTSQQQTSQQTKSSDRLLVANGRGKFTDVAWVGPSTSFPNWLIIKTSNKKAPEQNQQQQQTPQQGQQPAQPQATQPQAQTQPAQNQQPQQPAQQPATNP